MAENKAATQHTKKRYSTVFSVLLNTSMTLGLLSFISWLLLIIWFSAKTVMHNVFVVNQTINEIIKGNFELIGLHNHFVCSLLKSWVSEIEHGVHTGLNDIYYGLNGMLQSLHHPLVLANQQVSHDITTIFMGTLDIVLSRLALFVLNLPFLICVLFVLIVDGLGQRDIRKFQGARESAFIFHRIKPLTTTLFYAAFLAYSSAPCFVSPIKQLIPMSVIFSVMVMFVIKYYKKYV